MLGILNGLAELASRRILLKRVWRSILTNPLPSGLKADGDGGTVLRV
jgi:hypothetical protein